MSLLINDALVAVFAGLTVTVSILYLTRRATEIVKHDTPPPHCPECGYSLYKNSSNRCPECGQVNTDPNSTNHCKTNRIKGGLLLTLGALWSCFIYVFSMLLTKFNYRIHVGKWDTMFPPGWRQTDLSSYNAVTDSLCFVVWLLGIAYLLRRIRRQKLFYAMGRIDGRDIARPKASEEDE